MFRRKLRLRDGSCRDYIYLRDTPPGVPRRDGSGGGGGANRGRGGCDPPRGRNRRR